MSVQLYQYSGDSCKYEPVKALEPFIWNNHGVCINAAAYQIFDRNTRSQYYQDHAYIEWAEHNGEFYGGYWYWAGGSEGHGGGGFPDYQRSKSFSTLKDLVLHYLKFFEQQNEIPLKYIDKLKNDLYPAAVQLTLF